jgi:hypothetical protein
VTRLQAAYVDAGQVRELVARLRQGSRPRLLAATTTGDADGRRMNLRDRLRLQLHRDK